MISRESISACTLNIHFRLIQNDEINPLEYSRYVKSQDSGSIC